MKITRKIDLEKMNFTDFKVLNISIEKISKSIVFSLSGAWQLVDGKRIELGKGHLKITRYDAMYITAYNAREQIETVLSEDNFECLHELCEIDINGNELVIKGFARNTANWIEFTIVGGEVGGEFSDALLYK